MLCLACLRADAAHPRRESSLQLSSSDAQLVASFDWAKQQALAFVYDGDPVGPWYEATLPGRRAFCMRDVSHQAAGAQALGLANYNHNMLYRFAQNIAASRDWCSYWEIDYRNLPAPIDYVNDQKFWYTLPANFDVLDTCYRMYLWTGDASYIRDPVFMNFYQRTTTDYVSRWHLSLDKTMSRKVIVTPPGFYRGDPSYEESREGVTLGVDLLAAEYAGFHSFAAIQAMRGDKTAAEQSLQHADAIKTLINTTWWNPKGSYYYAYLDSQHRLQGRAGADLLYWDAAEGATKIKGALGTLRQTAHTEPADAVEPKSHYAEILYRYGDPAGAYAEIMDLSRPGRARREYPEVSYSIIGAIVNGLFGINVKLATSMQDLVEQGNIHTVVETLPALTQKTAWAEIRNLPLQNTSVTVRAEGDRKVVLSNQGKAPLVWQAGFPGTFQTLVVDGKPLPAHTELREPNRPISWVRVPVAPGKVLQVELPPNQSSAASRQPSRNQAPEPHPHA